MAAAYDKTTECRKSSNIHTVRYMAPVVEYTLSWDIEKVPYDKNH